MKTHGKTHKNPRGFINWDVVTLTQPTKTLTHNPDGLAIPIHHPMWDMTVRVVGHNRWGSWDATGGARGVQWLAQRWAKVGRGGGSNFLCGHSVM